MSEKNIKKTLHPKNNKKLTKRRNEKIK